MTRIIWRVEGEQEALPPLVYNHRSEWSQFNQLKAHRLTIYGDELDCYTLRGTIQRDQGWGGVLMI